MSPSTPSPSATQGMLRARHAAWPLDDVRPDLEFDTLAGLADWLDARG